MCELPRFACLSGVRLPCQLLYYNNYTVSSIDVTVSLDAFVFFLCLINVARWESDRAQVNGQFFSAMDAAEKAALCG
jgi:hypothetical protein